MNDKRSPVQSAKEILRDDPRLAIILAEILGPPPGLDAPSPKEWEEE